MRCGDSGVPGKGMEAVPISTYFALCISSIWFFLSYTLLSQTSNLVSTVKCFSESYKPLQQINQTQRRKRSLEPLIYSQFIRSTGENLDLCPGSEVGARVGGGSLAGLIPYPVGSDAMTE